MPEESEFIRFKTIIEVLGKPKEHVENSLNEYIEKIKETEDFLLLRKILHQQKNQIICLAHLLRWRLLLRVYLS